MLVFYVYYKIILNNFYTMYRFFWGSVYVGIMFVSFWNIVSFMTMLETM